MSKARLGQLADRLSEKPKAKKTAPRKSTKQEIVANPAHGSKGDFVKVTVTLPPEVYSLIMQEATRRKVEKLPNPQLSAILREAVVEYLRT